MRKSLTIPGVDVHSERARRIAIDALKAPLAPSFPATVRLANEFRVSTVVAFEGRIDADPLDEWAWGVLLADADAARFDDLFQKADRLVDFRSIATGPGMLLGLGPEYRVNGLADTFLQAARQYPGHGMSLIRLALRSPVIRNRWLAITAIEQWAREVWSEEVRDLVVNISANDSDENVRAKATELLESPSARTGA
jgi:hypothetical protein